MITRTTLTQGIPIILEFLRRVDQTLIDQHLSLYNAQHYLDAQTEYLHTLIDDRIQHDPTIQRDLDQYYARRNKPSAAFHDPQTLSHLSDLLTHHDPLTIHLESLAATALDHGASIVYLLRNVKRSTLDTDQHLVLDRMEPTILVALYPLCEDGPQDNVEAIISESAPP